MIEVLEEARRSRRQVEIVVSSCVYACCGSRAWIRRAGYEQTYRGVIANLDGDRWLLHAIAVSTLNYAVVADVADVLDVTFVDA